LAERESVCVGTRSPYRSVSACVRACAWKVGVGYARRSDSRFLPIAPRWRAADWGRKEPPDRSRLTSGQEFFLSAARQLKTSPRRRGGPRQRRRARAHAGSFITSVYRCWYSDDEDDGDDDADCAIKDVMQLISDIAWWARVHIIYWSKSSNQT